MGGGGMSACRQVLCDFYGCNDRLGDPDAVRAALVAAALAAQAEVHDSWVGRQAPAGALTAVLMPQAHMLLHSFPESQYASVDILFVDQRFDAEACQGYLEQFLTPAAVVRRELYRGGEYHPAQRYRQ